METKLPTEDHEDNDRIKLTDDELADFRAQMASVDSKPLDFQNAELQILLHQAKQLRTLVVVTALIETCLRTTELEGVYTDNERFATWGAVLAELGPALSDETIKKIEDHIDTMKKGTHEGSRR